MTTLSVNVNKIATLRNSRGKNQPDLIKTVKNLGDFGVKSLTVHPRPDRRHILYEDVRQIKKAKLPGMEFNVEGYPSPAFLSLMEEIRPDQCTLVPDPPGVLTSQEGWSIKSCFDFLKEILKTLKKCSIRTSLFLDPFAFNEEEMNALTALAPDRVELYTEAYADNYFSYKKEKIINVYIQVAHLLIKKGIDLNAGHDLNLINLPWFLKKMPPIKEVSIGHALICESLYEGLETVVKKYLKICSNTLT